MRGAGDLHLQYRGDFGRRVNKPCRSVCMSSPTFHTVTSPQETYAEPGTFQSSSSPLLARRTQTGMGPRTRVHLPFLGLLVLRSSFLDCAVLDRWQGPDESKMTSCPFVSPTSGYLSARLPLLYLLRVFASSSPPRYHVEAHFRQRRVLEGGRQAYRGGPSRGEGYAYGTEARWHGRDGLPDAYRGRRVVEPIHVRLMPCMLRVSAHRLFRMYFQEPPIPAGQFITRYPNRYSRFRYVDIGCVWISLLTCRRHVGKSSGNQRLSSSVPWSSLRSVLVTTVKSRLGQILPLPLLRKARTSPQRWVGLPVCLVVILYGIWVIDMSNQPPLAASGCLVVFPVATSILRSPWHLPPCAIFHGARSRSSYSHNASVVSAARPSYTAITWVPSIFRKVVELAPSSAPTRRLVYSPPTL